MKSEGNKVPPYQPSVTGEHPLHFVSKDESGLMSPGEAETK